MGKSAGTSTVIRPSKRIIYDTTEAVVSFLSENVNTCVDEFLEEWARVSKMVVIARESIYVFHLLHSLADPRSSCSNGEGDIPGRCSLALL
jgi:hypothetical protein